MGNIFFAIPVADADINRAGATFARWRKNGYQTAALVEGTRVPENCTVVLALEEYRGWAAAVNTLCQCLFFADWIVTGGFDVHPEPHWTADEIAAECTEHFGGTMGIMQPAGDRYGAIETKTACVSPWLGREFRRSVYGGRGPFCEAYRHIYADAELLHVAERMGCLWWRSDLTQYHDHYARRGERRPAHLDQSAAEIAEQDALYQKRMAAGWPGHEPADQRIPAVP